MSSMRLFIFSNCIVFACFSLILFFHFKRQFCIRLVNCYINLQQHNLLLFFFSLSMYRYLLNILVSDIPICLNLILAQ